MQLPIQKRVITAHLLLRRVLNVLLGKDAEKVTAHGEGLRKQIRGHTVARHENRVLGEARDLRIE